MAHSYSRRRTAEETRLLIFQAASRILVANGLSSLTLAAVAKEAGLSKGGLLYHFPNKLALIEALFEYHNGIFERRLDELTVEEGDAPGAWLRAYARASVEQVLDTDTACLYSGLFAAEERYATAHALMRQKYLAWQDELIAQSDDVTWATLIRLTVDGLWFTEMHRYAPLDPDRRTEIVTLIMQMTKQSRPSA